MTEQIKVFGGIISPGPALVLAELHIENPVQPVFDSPMTAFCLQYLLCSQSFAAVNEVVRLVRNRPVLLYPAKDHTDPVQFAPLFLAVQPTDVLTNINSVQFTGFFFLDPRDLGVALRSLPLRK